MKIIFCGTAPFAIPSLKALCREHEIVAVVTQPDRPGRRGMQLQPPPLKEAALVLGAAPIYQPHLLREELAPLLTFSVDLIVVVAYGQLLPPVLLQHPRLAALNVHPSLLPKYRGAAPLQWALLNGDKSTGVTIMHLAPTMDSGDWILQQELAIGMEISYGELHDIAAELGAEMLLGAIRALEGGDAPRHRQEERLVTLAPRLTSAEQTLDFNRDALALHNQVRALAPSPGAETYIGPQLLKIWRSWPIEGSFSPIGKIMVNSQGEPLVATGSGGLLLREVQPAGKKRMSARDWWQGMRREEVFCGR